MPFLGFLIWNSQMTLKVKVNDPIFNTNGEYPTCMFGANLVILAQICDEL